MAHERPLPVSTQRIYQGSGTDLPEILDAGMLTIDCLITDPPYGDGFKSNFAKTASGKRYAEEIANDADLESAVAVFMEVVPRLVERMADNSDLYVFCSMHNEPVWREVVNSLEGVRFSNMLIWQKGWPGLGDLDGNWPVSYELILYGKKGRRLIKSRRDSVIAIDRLQSGKNWHPTQKPKELIEVLIEQSTDRGDLVVDPFAGSGSTLLAAKRQGRNAIGTELRPDYVAKIEAELGQVGLFS